MRPEIVMVGAVGLALKDHGRDRTLKGLCGGAPRVGPCSSWATQTLQGACQAMVLAGPRFVHNRGAHPQRRGRATVRGQSDRSPQAISCPLLWTAVAGVEFTDRDHEHGSTMASKMVLLPI